MTKWHRALELVLPHAAAGVVAVVPAAVLPRILALATGDAVAAGPWWQDLATLAVAALAMAVGMAGLDLVAMARPGAARWRSWSLVGAVASGVGVARVIDGWPLPLVAAAVGAVAGGVADRLVAGGGRRARLLGGAALLLALGLVMVGPMVGGRVVPSPHRIVLVCVDTLRADHLSLGGGGRTTSPVPAELAAREGVVFDNVYSSSSWTLPSVASLMTSLHPPEHGAEDRGQRLPPGIPTLAGQLAASGWLTAGFATHIYVSTLFGMDTGFLEYRDLSIDPSFGEGRQLRADEVNRVVVPWLAHHADSRFFLYVHLFDPHWDYEAPPPFDRLFTDPEYRGPATGRWQFLNDFVATDRLMPPADLRRVVDLYDGEVAWTDSQLGVLFAALRDLGLWDDTLLVVTSDHGEEFQEHGSVHHIRTLYEEVLRVPLVVKLPGGRPSWVRPRVAERLRLLDVAPTLLELAGAAPLPGARGESFAPLVAAPGPDREVFAHTVRHASHKAAVIRGSQKVIVGYPPGRELVEVFDLVRDPREQASLTAHLPGATVEQLRSEVLAMVDGLRAARRTAPAPPVVLTPDQRRQLEALGYLEGDTPAAE